MKNRKILLLVIAILVLLAGKYYIETITLKGQAVERYYETNCLIYNELESLFESKYSDKEIRSISIVDTINRIRFGDILYSDKTKELYRFSNDANLALGKIDFYKNGDKEKVLELYSNFSNFIELNDSLEFDSRSNPELGEIITNIKWYLYFK